MPRALSARPAILALVAGVVFLVAVLGITNSGSERSGSGPVAPTDGTTSTTIPPSTSAPTTAAPARPGIPGFSSVGYTVTFPEGRTQRYCALLAETDEQQSRGMQGQTSLGGYDAMIFSFPRDVNASFFMFNVPVPLSIAWFRADGTLVRSTDMATCDAADQAQCPRYSADGPYRYAFETLRGQLEEAGLQTGATVQVGGPCP